MNTNHFNLIIIGSGPAGLTAAIYASRANLKPLVIQGKQPGGLLMGTSYIENWPGEQRILGPDLMLKMQKQAAAFGTQFLDESVVSVTLTQKPFIIETDTQKKLTCDALIIATGASPKHLHCPGENEYWGKGVTTCAVCDGAFYPDKKVIIVGGGDTAMENADFMLNFTKDITIIHILDSLTASHVMQQRIINNPSIKIMYESTVTAIHGDGTKVTGVTITHQHTKQTQNIPTDAVFIAIGLSPNVQPFKGQVHLNQFGFIEVRDHTRTSVPGVFVAGDVADYRYRQAVTSAGAGCMAALDAEKYLKNS